MKIGLLTFHKSINYGSVLQAYALQNFLEKYKTNVYIIDYSPIAQQEMYSDYKKNRDFKSFCKNILTFIDYSFIKKRRTEFEEFFNYYNLTKSISNKNYKKEIDNYKFDLIFVGSDQVWNTQIDDFDDIFFLPFDCPCKVAYAVSIGSAQCAKNFSLSAVNIDRLQELKGISVREEIARTVITNYSDKNIEVVLDPTFLLTRKVWDDLAGLNPIIEGKYIVLYSIEYYDDIIDLVKKYSMKYNMPVYCIYTCQKTYKAMIRGIKRAKECSPISFLNYIKYADLVFSSSFHGTVFSLIFNKNFFSIERVCGNERIYEDRIRTLLKKVDLEYRILGTKDNLDKMKSDDIDYREVNHKIEIERRKSIEFIEKMLS